MLDELTELAPLWEQPETSCVTQLYEASVANLHYTRQLLGHLATEPDRTDLSEDDLAWCRRSGRLADRLGRLLEEHVSIQGDRCV